MDFRVSDADEEALFAFGDPDDAHRLAIQLLRTAGGRRAAPPPAPGVVDWRRRHAAVRDALRSGQLAHVWLVDPDALYTGPLSDASRWDDAALRRERRELFDTLIEAAQAGGIRLRRTALKPEVSGLLEASGLSSGVTTGPSPDLRAAADWLVARGLLVRRGLEDLESSEADRVVLMRMLDTLDSAAESALCRLALVRPEVRFNGEIGPYPRSHLGEGAVREVLDRHLVLVSGAWCRIPRVVRDWYEEQARSFEILDLEEEHRRLAPLVEDEQERHHHAIEGRDDILAVESSTWYVADLRLLAVAHSRNGEWLRAAKLYEVVVARDPTDAYAWEYLGYNLARSGRFLQDVMERARIRAAYDRAAELDPENPLYAGRRDGFRAELGDDVSHEFTRRVHQWGLSTPATKWYAHAVIGGADRGRNERLLAAATKAFGEGRVSAWRRAPESDD
jgi:tetratricopeptide (TPR) repeat protein